MAGPSLPSRSIWLPEIERRQSGRFCWAAPRVSGSLEELPNKLHNTLTHSHTPLVAACATLILVLHERIKLPVNWGLFSIISLSPRCVSFANRCSRFKSVHSAVERLIVSGGNTATLLRFQIKMPSVECVS